MSRSRAFYHLYLLDLSLLIAHEVDSAYWHEWQLFGLPGGIQLFVLLNLALALGGLIGLAEIVRGKRAGNVFALVVALAGVFAFAVHAFFIATGHSEFTVPTSIAVLVATLVTSVPLAALAVTGIAGVRRGRESAF